MYGVLEFPEGPLNLERSAIDGDLHTLGNLYRSFADPRHVLDLSLLNLTAP
jgi:hypothetical protein